MRFSSILACAVLLALPGLANASAIKLTNNSSLLISYTFPDGKPELLPGNTTYTITDEEFMNGCKSSPNKCSVAFFAYNFVSCSGEYQYISTLTYNAHDGVIGIEKNPMSKVSMTPNRFDVTFSNRTH